MVPFSIYPIDSDRMDINERTHDRRVAAITEKP